MGLQQSSPSPRADREEKRRRRDFEIADRPIWSSPPEWLYLPHLGIGGGQQLRTSSSCASTTVHASADDAHEVAGTAGIRGRAASPGTRQPSQSVDSLRRVEESAAAAQGDSRPIGTAATCPLAPRRSDVRGRAETKLAARNSGLSISLADHAERVDRKRAQGRLTPELTATDRLAALRRRLEERVRARAGEVPTDNFAKAGGEHGEPAVLKEAERSSCAESSSKEDVKIHLVHAGGGIRMTTAERPRADQGGVGNGAGTLEDIGGGARGSAPLHGDIISNFVAPVDAATAAAARRVAWHTSEVTAPADAVGSN